MRILIDTNVILDILFEREPHFTDSIRVIHMCEDGYAEGIVTSKTISDVYFFLQKQIKNEKKVRVLLRRIMSIFTVCDYTSQAMMDALDLENADYEDATAATCAKAEKCNMIITRNKTHFKGTGIKCLTPEEFVN